MLRFDSPEQPKLPCKYLFFKFAQTKQIKTKKSNANIFYVTRLFLLLDYFGKQNNIYFQGSM